ncbi:lysozyme family protein [Roseivivax sp. CAU 1753]
MLGSVPSTSLQKGRTIRRIHVLFLATALLFAAVSARAEGFLAARQPLFPGTGSDATASDATADARRSGSLFSGQAGQSLLSRAPLDVFRQGPQSSDTATRIRHLIAEAEAGPKGYDAVQLGARVRPARAPTQMTIADIDDWIDRTPGQPHAIGRYQFIPPTLRRLVRVTGIDRTARFSPALQDRLADQLLREAGLPALERGDLPLEDFMHNLAKIWAGLPTSTGRSYYAGYAGNKATMTWNEFRARVGAIFPG